jgi:hypothetical protein
MSLCDSRDLNDFEVSLLDSRVSRYIKKPMKNSKPLAFFSFAIWKNPMFSFLKRAPCCENANSIFLATNELDAVNGTGFFWLGPVDKNLFRKGFKY